MCMVAVLENSDSELILKRDEFVYHDIQWTSSLRRVGNLYSSSPIHWIQNSWQQFSFRDRIFHLVAPNGYAVRVLYYFHETKIILEFMSVRTNFFYLLTIYGTRPQYFLIL